MNYEEAVAYILDVPKFTKKNTLDNTRAVLERLGRPDRRTKLIHVAGTNGKGSVCAYLASILKAAGKKTGLFTSPHLAVINERFQMDQEMISDELFLEGFEAVMEAVHALLEERPDTFSHPTFVPDGDVFVRQIRDGIRGAGNRPGRTVRRYECD